MPSNRLANLRAALAAFIREREYCGELYASVEADRVWMTCSCGPGAGARRGVRLIWKDRPSSGLLHLAELGPRIGATEFLGAPARG